MQYLVVLLLASQLIAAVTDREIRDRAAELQRIAAREAPERGISTLLHTAELIQPYVPNDARRLLRQAVELTQRRPDIELSSADVRRWMELDPTNGEAALRKLNKRRRVLEGIFSFYRLKEDDEKSLATAAELLRTDRQDAASTDGVALAFLAAKRPLDAVELFGAEAGDPLAQAGIMDSLNHLFTGLGKAAETQPEAVSKGMASLRRIVEADGFGADSRTVITIEYVKDGQKQKTATNRETVSGHLEILERLVQSDKRTSVRILSTHYRSAGAARPRPPVDASLSLPGALREIESANPSNMRATELWRYLVGKPRTGDEARPIVEKLIEWAAMPGQADPYWAVSSLLNLDGRLQWQLPAGLRPMVFQAAARLSPLARNAAEEIPRLLQAMREEKVPLPSTEAPSALAQFRLFELRAALETRYDFSLPALDGTRRSLRAARAKIVVLNFWATWCSPCRAEMPVLAAVLGEDVEVMAITDEPLDMVRGFVERNPIGVTVLSDPERKTFDHYRTRGIPQTFVLDSQRRLVKHFPSNVTEAELRAAIAAAVQTEK